MSWKNENRRFKTDCGKMQLSMGERVFVLEIDIQEKNAFKVTTQKSHKCVCNA